MKGRRIGVDSANRPFQLAVPVADGKALPDPARNGDRDPRAALVHDARAVRRQVDRHERLQSERLLGLQARRGIHRALVASGKEMARSARPS